MHISGRVLKWTRYMSDPYALWASLRWSPFSFASYELVKGLIAHGCAPATVIDIGSNEGQFARAILKAYPVANLYGFEPLRQAFERLKANFADDQRVLFRQHAVGNAAGKAILHVNAFSQSSSFLSLSENHKHVFPRAIEIGDENTEMVRLDDAMKGVYLGQPSLLKIDVQGYELEVLKGAPRVLGEVSYVLVEVGLVPLYVGEPAFSDVENFLDESGFKFKAALGKLRDEEKGKDIQMDALFVRRN